MARFGLPVLVVVVLTFIGAQAGKKKEKDDLGKYDLLPKSDYPKLKRYLLQLPNPLDDKRKPFSQITNIDEPIYQVVAGIKYKTLFSAKGSGHKKEIDCITEFFIGTKANAKPDVKHLACTYADK